MLRSERADLMRRALRRLPTRYRTCLLMREAEGLSCEEIGNRLQLSSGAVRTTLCRARQRLRSEYVALGGEVASAARQATTIIPIVVLTSADPVRGGLVASF